MSIYKMMVSVILMSCASALAGPISISVVPNSQLLALGNTAIIALQIAGLGNGEAPSLSTFDISVGFDPTVLAFNAGTFGDSLLGDQLDLFGLGSITDITRGSGTAELFELSLDATGDLNMLQSASFGLASLKFNTIGTGASPVP